MSGDMSTLQLGVSSVSSTSRANDNKETSHGGMLNFGYGPVGEHAEGFYTRAALGASGKRLIGGLDFGYGAWSSSFGLAVVANSKTNATANNVLSHFGFKLRVPHKYFDFDVGFGVAGYLHDHPNNLHYLAVFPFSAGIYLKKLFGFLNFFGTGEMVGITKMQDKEGQYQPAMGSNSYFRTDFGISFNFSRVEVGLKGVFEYLRTDIRKPLEGGGYAITSLNNNLLALGGFLNYNW